MPVNLLTLLVPAIIALLLLIRWTYQLRLVGLKKAWLPQELQNAALAYAERVFRASSPMAIVAKVDRGYRKIDGIIVLVELKTRHLNRPYLSDIIELSAQRLAVQVQTGERVANHGYVVIQQGRSKHKTAHRVVLLSTEEVTTLVKRREMILAGDVIPKYTGSEGLCDRCAFQLKCKQTADLRV